ncbi:MAG: ribonuclease HII [Candidatus Dormibacteria bacterium]
MAQLAGHPSWQLAAADPCGLDEVGRGALAGPLVAAAVVLPPGFTHPLLRDSKLLSERQREMIEPVIREEALALQVASIQVDEIDARGVGWANRMAFELLVGSVVAPEYLGDGNLRIRTSRPYRSVVGGDRLVPAISAASIVAKVFRDRLMRELHPQFFHYGWDRNKGYGSPHHLSAIRRHGLCPHHRRSFIHLEEPGLFDQAITTSA